ncbi:MAG: hypothetical protein JWR61_3224 [Ferruginibacter sp.]|nr:hypothetical protein [Ferruginibacter sp.]
MHVALTMQYYEGITGHLVTKVTNAKHPHGADVILQPVDTAACYRF